MVSSNVVSSDLRDTSTNLHGSAASHPIMDMKGTSNWNVTKEDLFYIKQFLLPQIGMSLGNIIGNTSTNKNYISCSENPMMNTPNSVYG